MHTDTLDLPNALGAQTALAVEYSDRFSAGGQTPTNKSPEYDIKSSDGELEVILEFGGIRRTHLLSLFPGPLWPRVLVPDKGLIYGLNRTKP